MSTQAIISVEQHIFLLASLTDLITHTNAINFQLVTELINFWFDKKSNDDFDNEASFDFWFDKTRDNHIKTKYQYLVDSDELINWYKIFEIYYNNNNQLTEKSICLAKLALLLIGDQFTRNIYRDESNKINYKKHDHWCVKLAQSMIESGEDLLLNLNMRFFILLPLRHQNKTHLLNIVRQKVNQYIKSYTDIDKSVPQSLIKFYAHTIKNYTYLTDTIIVVKPSISQSTDCSTKQSIQSIQSDVDILDENCIYWFDQSNVDINKIDMKQFNTHIIYRTLVDWLVNNNINSIGISLSGGVDSMIILSCFSMIKQLHPTLLNNIFAIHIEHSNRLLTAKTEREFLSRYCLILGITFYYRTIDYMNRTTPFLDRNIYETESKKLRFNLYKYVCEKENLDGICIGHHMGDITENVFTNIIKGRINEDLGQMKQSDNQFECQIYRPLLNLIKDNIFDFAHKFHIPYFKNSTPAWSCRGVIRDKMIPILKAQFGDFEPNIINFMNIFKEMSELNNKFIIKPYINSLIKLKYGYKIPFIKDMILDIVWDQILIDVTHSNGYHMISTKSKNNLINWLRGIDHYKLTSLNINHNKQYIAYELNKQYIAYYEKTNNYIYFIDHIKLEESDIIQLYKNNLIKIINGKKHGLSITLDMLLDGSIGSIDKDKDKDIFVDKKQIKLPQKIKQMLFA